ncbi:hypothetical protein COHA_007292 [Chlorella ohadii]|nr:hypothetical protein COHA_007292 [Chlorella ohadii]
MAEGEGIAGSVLEVPTWILAIIFLCLVVFSFLVEVVVHSCTHYFERRGRHGIAKAIMVVVFELTLLGLFGLILEAFSTPISHVCVPYSTGLQEWTFLYNIKGCPCWQVALASWMILADTRGVSLCAQVDRQCLTSYVDMKAYCDCDVTADPASYAGGWRCAAGVSPAPLAQEQRYCCTRGLQCRIAPAVTAVHAKLRANFWQHKSHVAGYANASASGRLSEECLPYRQAEAVHFAIDVGRALEVLADATNNSVPTVAELLTEPVAAMASADEGGVV